MPKDNDDTTKRQNVDISTKLQKKKNKYELPLLPDTIITIQPTWRAAPFQTMFNEGLLFTTKTTKIAKGTKPSFKCHQLNYFSLPKMHTPQLDSYTTVECIIINKNDFFFSVRPLRKTQKVTWPPVSQSTKASNKASNSLYACLGVLCLWGWFDIVTSLTVVIVLGISINDFFLCNIFQFVGSFLT